MYVFLSHKSCVHPRPMMRLLVQFARFLPKIPHRSFSDLKVRSTAASGSQVYDTERAVHEYLLLHYGNARDEKLLMPYDFGPIDALNFPRRSVELTFKHATTTHHHSCERPLRALDVGCSVGGTTFELSRKFEVVGIDYSQHFIDAANTMKNFGSMEFEVLKQGKIYQKNCLAMLKPEYNTSRVIFQQGDACQLNPSLGKFDLIFASNLLCRLPSPRNFIKSVPNFLNDGGKLVLISPYSWLEEYTPLNEWFGAKTSEDGYHQESFEELSAFLKSQNNMTLVHQENIPFLIREHERKFQYGVSDFTVWVKTN